MKLPSTSVPPGFVQLPREDSYWLLDATVPACCFGEEAACVGEPDVDGLCVVDIELVRGVVAGIVQADVSRCHVKEGASVVYLNSSMCWPAMVDLHTHIDKSHTFERTRNPNGTLEGADMSTAMDSNHWTLEDVIKRMDFSIQCAYVYGTCALRTHLINLTEKQEELTWGAFSHLRRKWAGKVEIQGVALVVLSYFRDLDKSRKLAQLVKEKGGVLGAAVSCSDKGGFEEDDWTTCSSDREMLLDRIFVLAKEFDLDLDFHADENGNEAAKGLRDICRMAIKHGYYGRVVCGHCCSLAHQSPESLVEILDLAKSAGVTVVSLPLVNEWLQDRSGNGQRTPRWRGVTALLELKEAGVKTALASDNTRDQFFAYGDLDMLDVFTQSVRIGHLDCPHSDWPSSVTSVPANAMRLNCHGRIAVGLKADFVLFSARKYSELLSRPQHDRVVLRNGKPIRRILPSYKDLDQQQAKNCLGPACFKRETGHKLSEFQSMKKWSLSQIQMDAMKMGVGAMVAILAVGWCCAFLGIEA